MKDEDNKALENDISKLKEMLKITEDDQIRNGIKEMLANHVLNLNRNQEQAKKAIEYWKEENLKEYIKKYFIYHPPTEDQLPRFKKINEACIALVKVIWEVCPRSIERAKVLKLIENVRMTANQCIAVNEATNV